MQSLLTPENFKKYSKEIEDCKHFGGDKASLCAQEVLLKYLREVPGMKDTVYPWLNYDWSYDIYIDNNYNKNKTGATPKGNIPALFKNPAAMFKLLGGFTFNPNPGKKSKAGISDVPQCRGDRGCERVNQVKQSYRNQKPPYPDPFFNKKIDGEMSSSYYIRTGSCPKPQLNKEECLKKGYQWLENPLFSKTPSFLRPSSFTSGSCYQPKYSFIKNNSGFQLDIPNIPLKGANAGIKMINKNLNRLKGELPSFTNDLISLSPNNVYKVMKGEDTPYISQMQCREPFCNYTQKKGFTQSEIFWSRLILFIFTLIIIIGISVRLRR